MKRYEVLPMTCRNGDIWHFACEIVDSESPMITIIGIGCMNESDAWIILNSFLED